MPSSSPNTDPDAEWFRELMLADEPDFDDLLECVFGITPPVTEVYRLLLYEKEATVKELARMLDCDESSVNRKLTTLQEQGLVTRHRNLLTVGGFAYEYEPTSVEQTQELMHETLETWTAFMHQQINGVEEILESPPSN